jgi:alkylation response protein AidB-like acyl-CoA dehydrogenase
MAVSWRNKIFVVMISERLSTILKTIRQFIQEEVVPLEPDFITRPFRELLPRLREKREKVKKLGLWAPQLPAKFDGLGLSLAEFARVSEELGRTPMGHYLFNCQAPDSGNLEILMEYGTPEQQETWMRPLARGDIRSCFSMTEPEFAGSNPTWMETSAVKEDNDYVLNGHKWFTSAADGAAFAIVMAVTNPGAASPHQRASQIIVPTDTPGFRLVRNISVMGHAGEDYLSHSEIRYENCRVPRKNLLGEEGKGFAIAQQRLGPGRIHHCMRWIGICERAFELMCQRASSRQLAPGQSLGTRQIVQEWIAECRAEILASRLMVLHTAEKIDQESTRAARVEVSLIKFYVANVLQKVLDRAIQVHGALGITDDSLLSHWYRHERGARIYDGPDEVHKTVVARMILKQYGLDIST